MRPLVWCDREQAIRELRDGETLIGISGGAAALFYGDTYAPMSGKAVMPEGGPSFGDSCIRAANDLTALPPDVSFDHPTVSSETL